MFYHLYYICHCLSKEHGGVKVFETGSAEKLLHPEQNNEGKAGRYVRSLAIIQDPPLTYHQEPLVLARLGENTDDSLRDSDAAYAGRFAALARALGAEKAYVV